MAKVLDIDFSKDEKMKAMLEQFNDIGADAIYMTHYELAEKTGYAYQPTDWKEFITHPKVVNAINEELDLIKRSKVMLLLKDIENNKSTGQAQLLNTLLNQSKENVAKEGPVFIYTYIPPNPQEVHAENVVISDVDPFEVHDTDNAE